MAATPNVSSPAALNPQEQRALDFLAQGRFRKARDEFKLLCKTDRAKYLPWLIKANIGLIREMIQNGLLDEARQVLAYLKTIAPLADLRMLEIELNGSTKDQPITETDLLSLLAEASSTLPETERRRVADRAVVAFAPGTEPSVSATPLAAELHTVQTALRAVAENRFDQAQEAIRPLPHGSVFSHWKQFIKGLLAFHGGDREKALHHFQGLPSDSVPRKASEPYLLLLGAMPVGGSAPVPSAEVLEIACRLLGEPGLGAPLGKAERAWASGEPRNTYETLKKGCSRFPAEGPNLLGALSEFCLHSLFTLPLDRRDDYGYLLEDTANDDRNQNRVEKLLLYRLMSQFLSDRISTEQLGDYWKEFLRLHQHVHGPNARLESLAYAWLGQTLAEAPPTGFFHAEATKMRDAKRAREALEKSLALDPANLAAGLALCKVYEKMSNTKERNRLLDRMTGQFPEEKPVLILAGRGCLERKVFSKGIEYLERARELDRLDPAIPDLLVTARFQAAQHYFKQGAVDKARATMAEAEVLEVDSATNLSRGRWSLRVRRGVLEQNFGAPSLGEAALLEARNLSPSSAAFLFFAHWIQREYLQNRSGASPFSKELDKFSKKEATLAGAIPLVQIFQHCRTHSELLGHYVEEEVLTKYVKTALKRPFTRAEACQLVELMVADDALNFVATDVIEKQLKLDPKDPLFQLFDYDAYGPSDEPEEDKKELQAIIDEAGRRQDERTARLARQRLDGLRFPAPQPPPLGPDGLADFFNPPDDEDEDGYDIPSPLDFLGNSGKFPLPKEDLPPMSEDEAQGMMQLLEVLGGLTPAQIKELKRTPPPGMSPQQFEMVAALARLIKSGGMPMPDLRMPMPPIFPPLPPFPTAAPAKPKPAPKPMLKPVPKPMPRPVPKPTPKVDPNQLGLF